MARVEVPVERGAVSRRRERPRARGERAPADADGGSPGRSRLGVITAGRCGADALLDDSESGRRAAVFNLWLDHDPQRCVLQVRELREYVGVRVIR